MKLAKNINFVQNIEVLEEIKFRIDDAGDVLTQLVAGQYKRPMDAFVRELGTNAYEAHQLLGKESEPFHVTLPTRNNSNWVIRDFGPGLSHEDIKSLYTSIGSSTKKTSNEMGGCFGLGSKSPFAYTNTFSVDSFFGGKKNSYLVYCDEQLFPHFDLIESVDSEEPSGLRISIPIKERDLLEIANITFNIYRHFLTKPKISKGSESLVCPSPSYTQSIKNFHIFSGPPSIKMGNIVYEIDTKVEDLGKYSNYNLLIVLPIGSVDVSTSRESLKYTLKTKTTIKLAFDSALQIIIKKFQEELDKCKDLFDASNNYFSYSYCRFINSAMFNFNGSKLLDKNFNIDDGEIFVLDYNKSLRRKGGWSKSSVTIQQKLAVFLIDEKQSYLIKIKEYALANNITQCVLVNETNNLARLSGKLNIPIENFIKTSTLSYTKKKRVGKKLETSGYNILQFSGYNSAGISLCWSPVGVTEELLKKKEYYISLNSFQPVLLGSNLYVSAVTCFQKYLGATIYGVRKSGKIPSAWINVESLLEDDGFINWITLKTQERKTYNEIKRLDRFFIANIKGITNLPNDLKDFCEKFKKYNNLMDIATLAKIPVNVKESKLDLVEEFKILLKKYKILNNYCFSSEDLSILSQTYLRNVK